MEIERTAGKTCEAPFPVYPDLVDVLADPSTTGSFQRHPTLAHVLGTCAGYGYADLDTVATVMSRVGFEAEACVRVSQAIDAMFVYSTALLLQSRCGRVAILCFRGTETANMGNWLGNAEVGSDSSLLSGGECAPPLRVHAGFHLNVRATRWTLIQELKRALRAGSLLDPERNVPCPLQALYVTGHSLGGAMAVLFALSLRGQDQHRHIEERLRAVYTYGQPMAVCEPVPDWIGGVARKLVRHVIPADPVPALPPVGWGPFVHVGQEYQLGSDRWVRSDSPVTQAAGARPVIRSILDTLRPVRRSESAPYLARAHCPQHYIAALRPPGRITELGD